MNVYIGYDPREEAACRVAAYSIETRDVHDAASLKFLKLSELGHLLTRPIEMRDGRMWCPISGAPMATEFAISRFAVPLLQDTGWALFTDCDIVCLDDVNRLRLLADPKYAVQVVKHNHVPTETVKMDGQVQTQYARKNWSSVVLWNCAHPSNRKLTVEVLNTWPGRDLHAFKWLTDDEIGELPARWNHLVDVSAPCERPAILHYTLGGPWIAGWAPKPSDQPWLDEYQRLTS